MLIRKIKSIGCWDPKTFKDKIHRDDATTPGDAIADLKTDQNGLSVWFTPDLEDEHIYPVIAAIATNRDSIQKVTYVVLDEEKLHTLGIEHEQIPGVAPGIIDSQILNRHFDLIDIDYKRLGLLAEYIQDLIKKKRGKTINEKQLGKYINQMIENKQINVDNLKVGIKNSLGKDGNK